MKKNRRVALLVILLLVLSGCGISNDTIIYEDGKEDNGVEKVELTESEVEILCDTYSNEDQIREGELYDYQINQVNRMRMSMKYLSEKYPNEEFLLVRCWEAPNDSNGYRFDFVNVKEQGTEYSAFVNPNDDTDIVDNYYVAVLTERYDKWLSEELSDLLGQKVLTNTDFNSYCGSDFCGNESMDEVKRAGDTLSRNTYIYIGTVDNFNEIAKCIYDKVMNDNLYGSYFIYSEDKLTENADDGHSIRMLQKDGMTFEKEISFQTWNEFKEN